MGNAPVSERAGHQHAGAALGVLTGLNVLNYLDRYVSAGILPAIIAALAITDSQAGSLQSIFILVYALSSPLMGWAGDRGRRIPLCIAGVVIWSAATFGSGLATSFALLLLARALVGIGEASYAVVTPSIISDFYPPDRRGRALALFYAAMPIGSALGYLIGGAVGEAYGWRAAFFVAGGPGLLLALGLLFIREPQRGRFDPPQRPASHLRTRDWLRALWTRRSYVVNTVAQTIYTFSIGGLAAWMPTYFYRERGMSLSRAGFLFGACLCAAGLVGTVLGGYASDRLSRRYPTAHFVFSGAALVASLPFVLLAVLAEHPAIFWPAMFVTLMLLFLNQGPLNAAMTNVLPSDLRGRGFALYTTAIHIFGDGASPKLIGMASDSVGLRLPVLLTGLLMVPAGLVLILGRRTLLSDMQQVEGRAV